MASDAFGVVRQVDGDDPLDAVRDLQAMLAEQRQRLLRFRDNGYLRRFSETSTRQRSSMVAGMMNCSLRTTRRWNQELQYILDKGSPNVLKRREAIDALLMEFAAAARGVAKEFIKRRHFGERDGDSRSPSNANDRRPSDASDVPVSRSRANSRADSRPPSRTNSRRDSVPSATSPVPPIGEDDGIDAAVGHGPWATSDDEAKGLALRISLCETPTIAKRAAKEARLQMRLLGLMVDMFPPGHLPVTVFPTCICTYAGHTVLVSSQPVRVGPSLDVTQCHELALALEYTGEAMNVARYDHTTDDGKEETRVGPISAAAFEGTDGRIYIETVLGMLPHFPPARGTSVTNEHTLFLRSEAVAAAPNPVSPGAYVTFGGVNGPKLRDQTTRCVERVTHEVIPRLAKELVTNPPRDAKSLVAGRMKPLGVNVALLGVLLYHVPSASQDVRAVIFTEMVARAARAKLRSDPPDTSEGVTDAFKQLCANMCNADEQTAAFEELLPCLHAKFPGSATMLSHVLRLPSPLFRPDTFATRLAELHGMVFAKGVSGKGTSAFHFSVDALRVCSPDVQLGPGLLRLRPADDGSKSPTTQEPDPDDLIVRFAESLRGADQLGRSGSGVKPRSDERTAHEAGAESPDLIPVRTKANAGLETQGTRATLFNRTLAGVSAEQVHEACKHLGEIAHHRSLLSGKASFAYRFELFCIGLHVGGASAERGIHFLSQALEYAEADEGPLSAKRRASPIMVRCLVERAKLLIENRRLDEAQRDLDDATQLLSAPRGAAQSNASRHSAFDDARSGAPSPTASIRVEQSAANALAMPIFVQLARLREARGDFVEAERFHTLSVHAHEALFGESHLETAGAWGSLGYALMQQGSGRAEEAMRAFENDIRICRAVGGEFHPAMATSTGNLAVLLSRLGRVQEAVELHRVDVAITSADPDATPQDLASSQIGLGNALAAVGEVDEAQRMLEEGLRGRLAVFGRNDLSVAVAFANVAHCLVLRYKRDSDRADLDTAEDNCFDAIAIVESIAGPAHRYLRIALEHLVSIYSLRADAERKKAAEQRIAEINEGRENLVPFRLALEAAAPKTTQ